MPIAQNNGAGLKGPQKIRGGARGRPKKAENGRGVIGSRRGSGWSHR